MSSIWWIKKDIRIEDNQALISASHDQSCIALYIHEPEWHSSYEFHPSQFHFLKECLNSLEKKLQIYGISLIQRIGEATTVLHNIYSIWPYTHMYSHQETGTLWTYQRDIRVSELMKQQGTEWKEYLQNGVFRSLKDRQYWSKKRSEFIYQDIGSSSVRHSRSPSLPSDDISSLDKKFHGIDKVERIRGGEEEAKKLLDIFIKEKSPYYIKSLSNPDLSLTYNSLLSAHISWGSISSRVVAQRIFTAQKLASPYLKRNMGAFESRLAWRCHFMQKLESNPMVELKNMNPGFDGMRENEINPSFQKAWQTGHTGFPIVDACMRCLLKRGWINFRMRAMLASFSAYQLWQHWVIPSQYLAKHFLDFEPGIHFSQFQMQSGVTGINTIRIYSPMKQTIDNAADGNFIKKYIPELSHIPNEYLHDLRQIPPLIQLSLGFKFDRDYPAPIVHPEQSYQIAKKKIFEWKNSPHVRKHIPEILSRYTQAKVSS